MALLPWDVPLEALTREIEVKEKKIHKSLLEHYCNLNIHDDPSAETQTGIMVRVGPENKEPGTIQRLIAAGMTISRLNIKDEDPEEARQIVQSIRQAVYNYSKEVNFVYPLTVAVDVRGPEITTGKLKGGTGVTIELKKGNELRLTTNQEWEHAGTESCLFVSYGCLCDVVEYDRIFIDSVSGYPVQLSVAKVGSNWVQTNIVEGGMIGGNMTVRIVSVPLEKPPEDVISMEASEEAMRAKGEAAGDEEKVSANRECSSLLSMEDDTLERQMEWCIDQDVDVILWPCTQTAWAIIVIKHLLGDKGKHIMIFACIETTVGFDNLDSILEKADGIYVDRTVLSLDMPIEKIFIAQKEIISKCNKLGKPVICKTSINEQMPTLCVTDLANLILDGADCIALQIEWELGMTRQLSQVKNPTKAAENCLSAASVICRQAENIVWQPKVYGNVDFMQMELEDGSKAVAISSVELSIRCRAVAIICLTNSGRTARLISRAKPLCPIVAVTRICQVARQLRLYRGTRPLHYIERPHRDWAREVEKRIQAGLSYCKMKGFCRSGDAYVAVSGHRRGSGYTNTVQVFYASGRDVVPVDFD